MLPKYHKFAPWLHLLCSLGLAIGIVFESISARGASISDGNSAAAIDPVNARSPFAARSIIDAVPAFNTPTFSNRGARNTPTQTRAANTGPRFTPNPGPVVRDDAFPFGWEADINHGDSVTHGIAESAAGTNGQTPPTIPLPSPVWSTLTTLAGLGVIAVIRRLRRKTA